jgi:adenylate cyclase class 2
VATETEVKIELADIPDLRRRLAPLNPMPLSGRHFEDNFVLDFPDGRLRSRGCLLRVRKTEGKDTVTFKGPPLPSPLFKSREELETQIDSAEKLLQIFALSGLKVWFRYQKYREEYSIPVSGGPLRDLSLALDITPIGNFLELEGSEAGIREIAAKLGFDESRFLRDSYYALFLLYCRERGETPESMVFPGRAPAGDGPG